MTATGHAKKMKSKVKGQGHTAMKNITDAHCSLCVLLPAWGCTSIGLHVSAPVAKFAVYD